nr:uncharacterized protein LOC127303939 [Lolium perenne]
MQMQPGAGDGPAKTAAPCGGGAPPVRPAPPQCPRAAQSAQKTKPRPSRFDLLRPPRSSPTLPLHPSQSCPANPARRPARPPYPMIWSVAPASALALPGPTLPRRPPRPPPPLLWLAADAPLRLDVARSSFPWPHFGRLWLCPSHTCLCYLSVESSGRPLAVIVLQR